MYLNSHGTLKMFINVNVSFSIFYLVNLYENRNTIKWHWALYASKSFNPAFEKSSYKPVLIYDCHPYLNQSHDYTQHYECYCEGLFLCNQQVCLCRNSPRVSSVRAVFVFVFYASYFLVFFCFVFHHFHHSIIRVCSNLSVSSACRFSRKQA